MKQNSSLLTAALCLLIGDHVGVKASVDPVPVYPARPICETTL